LREALALLLDGRCYHMSEVFEHLDDHVPVWHAAIRGEDVDWHRMLDDYVAIVDWPGAACWDRIADAYPDAVVLLSTRRDADTWWRSASATILSDVSDEDKARRPDLVDFGEMVGDMFAAFDPDWRDEAAAKAAYDRHNARVRAAVPPSRLVEWQPGDGWEPICSALALPVPAEPFPHTNTTEEFLTRRAAAVAEGPAGQP
jgi:hypothetical protein